MMAYNLEDMRHAILTTALLIGATILSGGQKPMGTFVNFLKTNASAQASDAEWVGDLILREIQACVATLMSNLEDEFLNLK